MWRKRWWLGALCAAAATAAVGAQLQQSNDLVVHEWGTFLAMNGSDGVALEGMYHEEHALPAFVHARSKDQLRLPSVILKGETPVIYFYTEQAQRVRVEVKFPSGVWTQWYPQAQIAGPQFAQTGDAAAPRNGRLMWCANIIPSTPGKPVPQLPQASAEALWNYARDVDAAYVVTGDHTIDPVGENAERFLFYRGLGAVPLPIRFTPASGGTLASGSEDTFGAQHIFIIRVENGRCVYAYRPALRPGEELEGLIPSMDEARPLAEMTSKLGDDLAARLVASGLYPKEARAMVNTWKSSYFQTEGTRALFVMPQAWTDQFIPLTIQPVPRQTVRVMVGRIELLTAERERLAEQAIGDLESPDAAVREKAFAYLRDQGRYVEPIIRRVLKTSQDEQIKILCKRLLATDFVTELRAALHGADGTMLRDQPAYVRAQLAILLKEVGLTREAKAEAECAIAELKTMKAPAMDNADSRGYLRAYARAFEASGDDQAARDWYSRFIKFGSQIATSANCRGCHRDAGPREMTWFRDWWAGAKYAEVTARLGQTDRTIAEYEAAAARNDGDVAARMSLAYLYASRGRKEREHVLWSGLDSRYPGDPVRAGE